MLRRLRIGLVVLAAALPTWVAAQGYPTKLFRSLSGTCITHIPHRGAGAATFRELGLEPVNRMACYGIVAPKGVPKDVVDKISAAARKALEDANARKRIEDTGSLIVASSPAEFAGQGKAEFEVYRRIDAQKLELD
jgi:hypothetical protein